MENKIKKRNVEKKEFVINCPYCKKEIVGYTEGQVRYNLDIHIMSKHKEEKLKDMEKEK